MLGQLRCNDNSHDGHARAFGRGAPENASRSSFSRDSQRVELRGWLLRPVDPATTARRPASASRRSPPACTSSAAFLASFKAEKPTSRRTTFQGADHGPRGGAQHCCGMSSRRPWGAHAFGAPSVCTNGQVPLTASTRDTPPGGAEGCGNDHAADGYQEDLLRSDGSIRPGVVHRPTKLTLTSEAGSAPAGPSSV